MSEEFHFGDSLCGAGMRLDLDLDLDLEKI